MLEVKNLTVSFGGLKAVNDMNMVVQKGEIHSLIGPNGAGKTTMFNAITRVIRNNTGDIYFKGESLNKVKSFKIIYKGITRTFQNLQLFKTLNVYQNILSGFIHNYNGGVSHIFSDSKKNFEREARIKILEVAEILDIKNRLLSYPSQLSYGILKRVEIARAIVSNPEIVLFDEPAAGLNHNETSEIRDILKMLNDNGKTIFLVEHDMNLVMKVSKRITVMSFGKKIAEGTPKEIANNEKVITEYLGETKNA